MSSVQRILTGLEFVLDPHTAHVQWPSETEDVVRLSIELARLTRSGLAFAAVAPCLNEDWDCATVDRWLAEAEQQLEGFSRASPTDGIPIEHAAWFGSPGEEWARSARESNMDLLIVPGATLPLSPAARIAEHGLPERAGCPVWFAGREPDSLAAAPPLIAFCDDLSADAVPHLLFAVELALAWNARLLIVHPLAPPSVPLGADEEDRLRREVFVRLSRTDFRALSHGSQLRLLPGGLDEILQQVSTEQAPNLLMASAKLTAVARPSWRGHLYLWGGKAE